MIRLIVLAACAVSLMAQTAQLKTENAKVETRPVNGSLDATVRTIVSTSAQPAWIGYSVAQVAGERQMCGTVALEGARDLVMLYRVEGGQIQKIREYAIDCTFDTADLTLYWLTGVDGSQSATFLESFVNAADPSDRRSPAWQLGNQALGAISRHKDGAPALIDLARRQQLPPQMRQEAVRWLGRSKDPRATKFFEEILASR